MPHLQTYTPSSWLPTNVGVMSWISSNAREVQVNGEWPEYRIGYDWQWKRITTISYTNTEEKSVTIHSGDIVTTEEEGTMLETLVHWFLLEEEDDTVSELKVVLAVVDSGRLIRVSPDMVNEVLHDQKVNWEGLNANTFSDWFKPAFWEVWDNVSQRMMDALMNTQG